MTVISRLMGLSLAAKILIGLGIGIVAGLFFGEMTVVLQPVADAYIRLMQMTVLPYLVTSLVIAFGALDFNQAKKLALRGGLLLFMVWILVAVVLVAVPFTFPAFESAAFFSHSLVEPTQSFSLTEIYFTSNPFESLSRNVVPAVVLFSCLVGIGLIGMAGKEQLLDPLRLFNKAIVRVTNFVIKLTPIGVFAIGAVTAGSMSGATITQLEVYFIAFAVAALLLAFWVLPLLVTAVTPFSYREVAGIARDALLTAFVTHSAFIVLPILIERSKTLLERHGLLDETTDSAAEVMIPVMFNFPNAGKLLTLLFIPFAAWLAGTPMPATEYPEFLAAGFPSYFAKAQIALPFLLDLFSLPHDLFQLYIPTTIITGKFDSLLSAMNLLVFALLGAGAMGGFLVWEKRRLLTALAGISGGIFGVFLGLKILFAMMVDTSYHLDETVKQMHNVQRDPDTIVHFPDQEPVTWSTPGQPLTMQQIRERGTLRIGYDPYNLPMSFLNEDRELVGFDIELGERLAGAMELEAEFVPINWVKLPTLLAEGVIDVMPGVWYRPYWFPLLGLTDPYFVGNVGVAVRDDRRHEFATLEKIREAGPLTIAVPLDRSQIELSLNHYFSGVDAEFVTVEFWKPYFEGEHPDVDAFLMPAENASGWTLLHPEFSVVVPQPDPIRIPSAFGVAHQSSDLANQINQWIIFADGAGIIDQAYRYWILGRGAEIREPRWSVIRDVLGWTDQ